MPLMPAMRPLAASSHTLAAPISSPPRSDATGVKLFTPMIFRQLFEPQSSTYTYLLADAGSREALLIDPVLEQARRDASLLDERSLKLTLTLETLVHADDITGAWLRTHKLRSRYPVPA